MIEPMGIFIIKADQLKGASVMKALIISPNPPKGRQFHEKRENVVDKVCRAFASVALKTGIASSNSACRFGYYQNTVPAAMAKFKK